MYQLERPRWKVFGQELVVSCNNEAQARSLIRNELKAWKALAEERLCQKAWIRYPGCRGDGFPISLSNTSAIKLQGLFPDTLPLSIIKRIEKEQEIKAVYNQILTEPFLHAEGLPLTPGVRAALDLIAESPQEQWFLHRFDEGLNNSTQVALTESCQSLIIGANPKEAVGRKRSDYTHPEDVDGVIRQVRELEPSNPASNTDILFRMFSPVTRSNWRRVRNNYRIVDAVGPSVFVLAQCMDCVSIVEPVLR